MPPTPSPDTRRDFRLFLTGQATSTFGSVFTALALPVIAVRHLGASTAEMGLIAAAGSLPLMVLGVFIAAWVDRLPRRRPYLIACELVAAAAVACVMLALVTGQLAVWELVVFAAILGVLGVIGESTYFVHLRALVPDGGVVRARARLQGAEQMGGVAGRVLVGPVMVVGVFIPFLVDLVSYLVSAFCLARIRRPEPPREAGARGRVTLRELGEGFAVIRGEPFLRQLTPFLVGQQIVSGVTLAVLAPFLLTVLGVPTAWYGALFLLAGVAAVAGTAVTARLADRVDARTLAATSYLGVAATALLLPFAAGPLPVAAALATLGIGLPYFFSAIANVGMTAFVTEAVPEEKLGRSGAALQFIGAAAVVAGSLGGGLLAAHIGIRPTLWAAAALSVASMLALRPALRSERRADQTGRRLTSPS